jgi:hypothetical protein
VASRGWQKDLERHQGQVKMIFFCLNMFYFRESIKSQGNNVPVWVVEWFIVEVKWGWKNCIV